MKDNLTLPYLELGEYEHYKGNRYDVIGVAMHEEELVPLVIYKPLYETKIGYWARPYDMFVGEVVVDGKTIKRFTKV